MSLMCFSKEEEDKKNEDLKKQLLFSRAKEICHLSINLVERSFF